MRAPRAAGPSGRIAGEPALDRGERTGLPAPPRSGLMTAVARGATLRAMRTRCVGMLMGVVLMGASARSAAQTGATGDELVAMSRARLAAVDAGDRAAYGRGLDPDGVFVDEDAVVRTGSALLDEVRPLPAGYVGHIELQHPTVRITDGVGVVTYDIAEDLAL